MRGGEAESGMTPRQRQALDGLRASWGSMNGKRVLVTGATRGIGRETALQLAGLGASVVVHGRDAARGAETLAAVGAGSPEAEEPEWHAADLAGLSGVRALAAQVRDAHPRLDVLVANAGVFASERRETADGLELTFAVNVVAPLLLASELLSALRATAPARIVVVSSASHWTGEIHWDDLQLARPGAWSALAAYDQSKLAVLMLTLALARRLQGTGVTATCLDPGDVATTMLSSGWPELPGIPVEYGAVTSVYLASALTAEGLSGVYLEDGEVTTPLAAALDVAAQERLWSAVEEVTGPLAHA